jgi:hypothetical protein
MHTFHIIPQECMARSSDSMGPRIFKVYYCQIRKGCAHARRDDPRESLPPQRGLEAVPLWGPAASPTEGAEKGHGRVLDVYNVADGDVGAEVRLNGPLSWEPLANLHQRGPEEHVIDQRGGAQRPTGLSSGDSSRMGRTVAVSSVRALRQRGRCGSVAEGSGQTRLQRPRWQGFTRWSESRRACGAPCSRR